MDKFGYGVLTNCLLQEVLLPKDIQSDMIMTLENFVPSLATVKGFVAEFRRGNKSLGE